MKATLLGGDNSNLLGRPKCAMKTFSSSSVFIRFREKTIAGSLPLPLTCVIYANWEETGKAGVGLETKLTWPVKGACHPGQCLSCSQIKRRLLRDVFPALSYWSRLCWFTVVHMICLIPYSSLNVSRTQWVRWWSWLFKSRTTQHFKGCLAFNNCFFEWTRGSPLRWDGFELPASFWLENMPPWISVE